VGFVGLRCLVITLATTTLNRHVLSVTLLFTKTRGLVCLQFASPLGLSNDWNAPGSRATDQYEVVEVSASPVDQPAWRVESLTMIPAQVATARTHHVYGHATGDEREDFLNKVAEVATAYGVRGSTVSRTAGVDTLVEHLLSAIAEEEKTFASHQASCRDRLQSVRYSVGLGGLFVLLWLCRVIVALSVRLQNQLLCSLWFPGFRSGGPRVGVSDEAYSPSDRATARKRR